MGRIDCSGAEVGSVIELDATATTLLVGEFSSSATFARSGLRSWKAQVTGATDPPGAPISTEHAKGRMNVAGGPTVFSVRFSFYVQSAGLLTAGENVEVFTISDNAFNLRVALSCQPTGFSVVSPNAPLTIFAYDTWHNLSIRCVLNIALPGNVDTFTWRMDNESWSESRDLFDAGIAFIEFGIVRALNQVNAVAYIDDIVLDNTNVDIGDDLQLAFFAPNATDSSTLVLVGAAATQHAAVTDEDGTTAVRANATTGNVIATFSANDPRPSPLPTSGSTAIACVYGSCRVGGATDSVTGTTQRFLWSVLGNVNDQATPTPSLTVVTRRSTLVKTTRPQGGAWLSSDMAIIKPIVGKATSALAETYTFQEVWLYAELLINVTPNDTSPTMTETASYLAYSEGLGGGGSIVTINE